MRFNMIVLSYNRPRMLREAVRSVLVDNKHQDTVCWILDDGSDFDVMDLVYEFKDDRLVIAQCEKVTPEERAYNSERFADNVNFILEQIPKGEAVGYLCDDDILGPDFLSACSYALDFNSHLHLMSGEAYYFYDGQNPYDEGIQGFKAPEAVVEYYMQNRNDLIWWNVGNFVHRSDCFYDEELKWVSKTWGDKKAHSWDVDFIRAVTSLPLHATHIHFKIPAMYRREHDNMLSARLGRLNGSALDKDSRYVFDAKDISPEMVEGMME